jgi:hypothetical protein
MARSKTQALRVDENLLSSLLPLILSFSVFNLRLEGWVTGVCGWQTDEQNGTVETNRTQQYRVRTPRTTSKGRVSGCAFFFFFLLFLLFFVGFGGALEGKYTRGIARFAFDRSRSGDLFIHT